MKYVSHSVVRRRYGCLVALFAVTLSYAPVASAQPGQVLFHQKISDTAGSFSGTLKELGRFGHTSTGLGDLDLDGTVDMAVGAHQADGGGLLRGEVWIIFLQPNARTKSFQRIAHGDGGLQSTIVDDDHFGRSVQAIGDLNSDGTTDIAVGAYLDQDGGSTASRRGACYLLFLNSDGTVKAEQKVSQTAGGFTASLSGGDSFGLAIGHIGDLDNDGVTDIAVGAPGDDDGGGGIGSNGAVWILFLNLDGTVKSQQKISDTQGGFGGGLFDGDEFGYAVVGIGDLDGDGSEDIAVGAPGEDDGGSGTSNRGGVWIVFLNNNGTVKAEQKISSTVGNFTGAISDGDSFGRSLAYVGDQNGDGIGDIAVGADRDDDDHIDAGAVWILFLDTDGTVVGHQKISDTVGNFSGGIDANDNLGAGLGALGDLDNNGRTDLIAGSIGDDDGGGFLGNQGAVFLMMLGDPNTTTTTVSTSTSSTTTTTLPLSRVCGDATGEGVVTATDALEALKTAVGTASCPLCSCDSDNNNAVTATDALRILQSAVGQSLVLTCPEC